MAKTDYISEINDIDTWCTQIAYWRSHLDVYLQTVFKVRLTPDQQVIARACSDATNVKLVQSRGSGKSWLIAWICIAVATLYPNTPVAVVSATAQQATIVIRKIQSFIDTYPELLPQIRMIGRDPVVVAADKGKVWFKNGSKIESYSTTSIVGERAKVIIADEAYRIDETVFKKNVTPCANYTRDICIQNHYDDFDSKIINITSACLKSNYFYNDFVETYNDMKNGNQRSFACALDWRAAVDSGITKEEFFEERRRELPESIFESEYGSIFLGEEANTVFPFELTSGARRLKRVEYMMPKGSKAWYIMGVDLATSSASSSDNAVITVLKCTDKEDGSIIKQLVYMRSYNGKRLDDLSDEIRETYVRFPNIEKIIFDHRGLGDSFPLFFNTPWVDPDTDKEYPPWCLDDESSPLAVPMLRSFKANMILNQELVTALRVSLEQKTLIIPIESRSVNSDDFSTTTPLRKEEVAIYIETDALQVEMGNLVMKVSTGSGNVTYDTAKAKQHKDRYSSLAMAVWYVHQIETENKKRIASRMRGTACIGVVSHL